MKLMTLAGEQEGKLAQCLVRCFKLALHSARQRSSRRGGDGDTSNPATPGLSSAASSSSSFSSTNQLDAGGSSKTSAVWEASGDCLGAIEAAILAAASQLLFLLSLSAGPADSSRWSLDDGALASLASAREPILTALKALLRSRSEESGSYRRSARKSLANLAHLDLSNCLQSWKDVVREIHRL